MLGAARNFVGDLPGAVRTLEATTGHGLADFDISNCKSVPGLILANSLVAAGQFRATVGKKMMDCVWPPVTEYLLEAGDFDDASRSINGYHWDNVSPEWIWIKEACAAFDGRDVKTLHDALAKVEALALGDFSYNLDDELDLGRILLAMGERDRAHAVAIHLFNRTPNDYFRPPPAWDGLAQDVERYRYRIVGFLVAMGEDRRADAFDKGVANEFRSGGC